MILDSANLCYLWTQSVFTGAKCKSAVFEYKRILFRAVGNKVIVAVNNGSMINLPLLSKSQNPESQCRISHESKAIFMEQLNLLGRNSIKRGLFQQR